MYDLIKIEKDESGIQTVNARDLHEFLGVKTKFNDWLIPRIVKYQFLENIDFVAITEIKVTAQGNHSEYKEYHISLDMAKELSMVENTAKGKEARKYFIMKEKQANSPAQVDYEVLGKMIGMAVSSAMAPIVLELKQINSRPQTEEIQQDYFSIKAYNNLKHLKLTFSECLTHGKKLTSFSNEKDIEVRKVSDERFGQVNSYSLEVLDDYFRA